MHHSTLIFLYVCFFCSIPQVCPLFFFFLPVLQAEIGFSRFNYMVSEGIGTLLLGVDSTGNNTQPVTLQVFVTRGSTATGMGCCFIEAKKKKKQPLRFLKPPSSAFQIQSLTELHNLIIAHPSMLCIELLEQCAVCVVGIMLYSLLIFACTHIIHLTENVDFTLVTKRLVFDAGEREKAVSVSITDDDLQEPLETFGVQLIAAAGEVAGVIVQGTTTVIIEDNDCEWLEVRTPFLVIGVGSC